MEDSAKTKKATGSLPEKFKQFISQHAGIWQFIKFSLMSSIAAVVEITSFMLLNSLILKSLNNQAVDWFVFHYNPDTTGGLGTMVAFLVSTTLAQIVAFIANRKKTFNANNNLAFSITVYSIMMVTIILVQTWSGPILVEWMDSIIHNSDISGLLSKLLWMFISFLIIFPMSKYVIMRKVDKEEEQSEDATPQEEPIEPQT